MDETLDAWLTTTWPDLAMVVLCGLITYLWIIILTRLNGLRSFSKMSAFDFVMTVSVGTLLGSAVVDKQPPLLQAGVALAVLFFAQTLIAMARRNKHVRHAIDNTPLLVMDGERVVHENLRKARIQESDLMAQLRQHGVCELAEVRAVIVETTGDVSVLKGEGGLDAVDVRLLSGVGGAERHPERVPDPCDLQLDTAGTVTR